MQGQAGRPSRRGRAEWACLDGRVLGLQQSLEGGS